MSDTKPSRAKRQVSMRLDHQLVADADAEAHRLTQGAATADRTSVVDAALRLYLYGEEPANAPASSTT